MAYTREGLVQALTDVVESLGGVRHLFSNHRLQVDADNLDCFEQQWPSLQIESRIGKVASIIGPSRIGDRGIITAAYLDLCRTGALAFDSPSLLASEIS